MLLERDRGDHHQRVQKGVAEERRGRQRARERSRRRGDFSAGRTFQLNRRNHHRAPVPSTLFADVIVVHSVRRGTRFADERKFLHSTGP